MSYTALFVWSLVAVMGTASWRRSEAGFKAALRFAWGNFKLMLPMMALAFPAAGFISELIPDRMAEAWVGRQSGATGILLATVIGMVTPGGPFISFPLVLAFLKAGAGPAQMVALVSAWSLLGFHRLLVWELPMMGWRFVVLRICTALALPALSGLFAEALLLVLRV
ncbi:MAG: hypothetical protein IT557_03495 [Alphaproteobacteria bacterium]|nr:hypothetical protein [Alphaproteobacteria bacterium]